MKLQTKKIKRIKKLNWFNPGKIIEDLLWNDIVEASKYASGSMLDVGSGNKPYYEIFKERVSSYIGIDARYPGADILGDFLTVEIQKNTYNTVLCTQVLEHVPEPDVLLQKIYQTLKKNGLLILSAPLINSLHETPFDYYRYTRYGLEYLLKKNKFEIISIKGEGDWITAISSLVCFYLEGTYNRYLLRYPKKFLIGVIQFLLATLSRLLPARFRRADLCPINYLVIAKKIT